jgi:hypothetical protein
MLTRVRKLWSWAVLIADDILVEQVWARMRRGDVRGAFAVLADLATGWIGCTAVAALLVALAVALVVGLVALVR